jgi:sugar phosphate permease
LVLVGITVGSLVGWDAGWVIGLLVVGPILLAAFVLIERRVERPMFDLSLFRIRTFLAGNLAAFFAALARGAFSFMMVFYFQGVVLLSALQSGIYLLPLGIAFAVVGPLSGTISDRTGARYLGTAGLLVSAAGFAVLITFPAFGPYALLAGAMVLLGVGQGMFAAPNRAEVMSSVPASRRGVAAGTGTTFLNGGNLGSLALGFTVLATVVPLSTLEAIFSGQMTSEPIDVGAFMSALHLLFAIGLALTLVAAFTNALRGRRGPLVERAYPHPVPRPTRYRGTTSAPGDDVP